MFWFIYLLIFLIGLAQTPILVDLLRLIFPEWRIKRLTDYASVYLLRVLMTVFFFIGLYQHMFLFVPLMPDVSFRTLKLAAHCTFTYWVWLNMTINYYLATFMSPGYCAVDSSVTEKPVSNVTKTQSTNCTFAGDNRHQLFSRSTATSSSSTTADSQMPDQVGSDGSSHPSMSGTEFIKLSARSHYCKICCKTVLYMDHHCPFTGNCVGIRNYSHFLLSLIYAWIGLAYGISTCLFYFGECWLPTIWTRLGLAYLNDSDVNRGGNVCPMLMPYREYIFPVIGGFCILTLLILFQIFLLLSDMSTYDVLKNFWTQPIFQVGLKRIRELIYRSKESRLNVLLLQNRYGVLSFVVPIKSL